VGADVVVGEGAGEDVGVGKGVRGEDCVGVGLGLGLGEESRREGDGLELEMAIETKVDSGGRYVGIGVNAGEIIVASDHISSNIFEGSPRFTDTFLRSVLKAKK
jgi:hypothetical protein